MGKLEDAQNPYLTLAEQASAPATPGSGLVRLYRDTDGSWYEVDDAGTVTTVGAGSSPAVVQLDRKTLASAAATIAFGLIPATYRHLRLVLVGRGTASATSVDVRVRCNGDTAANYEWQRLMANNTTVAANAGSGATTAEVGKIAAATAPAGSGGHVDLTVYDYAATNFHKTMSSVGWFRPGTGAANMAHHSYGASWLSTAAINDVTFSLNGGNFAAGTVATLYGIS